MTQVGAPDELRTSAKAPRIVALDGLRGLAVLAVLAFHGGHLRGGYLGVDLFFVLSGFLITTLLLTERRDRGGIGLRHFYERRARRLLPALGIALLLVAVYAAVWARPEELSRIRWDGYATLFYFANWRDTLAEQSYWDIFRAPSALQHTWSLSIEEQFYVLWPLVIAGLVVMRQSVRSVLVVAVVLGAACAAFTVLAATHRADQRLLYYGTQSRAPSLLMGAALAALVAYKGTFSSARARVALEIVALAGVAYLAYAWTQQSGDTLALYRGPLLLCGVAATAVIAAASHPTRGPIAHVLSFPVLIGAGLISYGLYLYHWPIYLILTPARTGLSGWTLLGVRVLVSVALAVVSYVLIEKPVRFGALRRPRPALVTLVSATTAVLVAIVLATRVLPVPISTAPAPAAAAATQPTTPAGVEAARTWPRPVRGVMPATEARPYLPPGDWSRLTNNCQTNTVLPAVRRIGPTSQPKILVVGDSIGCYIGAALDINQVGSGVVSLNRAQLGCPLARPLGERSPDGASLPTYPACTNDQDAAITAFKPDVALLMVGGAAVNRYDVGTGDFVDACDSGFASWYENAAQQTIATLSATGATVVVVSVVHPPAIIDVGPGISVPAENNRDVDCQNGYLHRVVAGDPHARWLDLDAYICPDGDCRAKLNGVTLRADGRHFQSAAANVVSAWMLPRILTLAGIHGHL